MAIHKYPAGSVYEATITAGGSNNTKGSWTELVAATPAAGLGLYVSVNVASATSNTVFVDVGIGGAGAESVVIANVFFTNALQSSGMATSVFVPVAIPSGSRVSARAQSSSASISIFAAFYLVTGSSTAVATTYGATTATTTGVTIDAGASANTKGAYSELAAATTAAIDWLIVLVGGRRNTTPAAAGFALDLATGGAGSETVVVPSLTFASNSGTAIWSPVTWGVPVSIASGTRLAARLAASTNDATDRLVDLVVIGITNSGMTGGGGSSTSSASSFPFTS